MIIMEQQTYYHEGEDAIYTILEFTDINDHNTVKVKIQDIGVANPIFEFIRPDSLIEDIQCGVLKLIK